MTEIISKESIDAIKKNCLLDHCKKSIGLLHDTVVERQLVNFPCPARDLQLTGDHLCG